MPKPRADIAPNSIEFETLPLVKPTGFREYDARWWFGIPGSDKAPELNLLGAEALGLGMATLFHELGVQPKVVTGHDFRSISLPIKNALKLGLVAGGCEVLDVGLALSPMVYWAQFELDADCCAMVTASHNENGWTGVKMGANKPLTFGPDEMGRLKEIVLNGDFQPRAGGGTFRVDGLREKYIASVSEGVSLKRKLKVIAACGNGTAGAFAADALRAMGADVIEMDCDLDNTFPKYNPNPEDSKMLHEMAKAVKEHGADVALGFDGDGDRCGVVDNTGEEIFADKIGLMLARDLSRVHPGANFVVDVKSTGLYKTDPVLKENGSTVDYYKTGHSYIKRRTTDLGALAGFEKSGHFFFRPPIGLGYDDGIVAAGAILQMLDRNPDKTMADLKRELGVAYTSLTMSPHCDDEIKYSVIDKMVAEYEGMAGKEILGRKVVDVNTVNGARVTLEDGSWVLVRASSNKPELVVVVESLQSEDDMRDLFRNEVKPRLGQHQEVGEYNQEI
ncbi:phosphomannomutase/phosphoglucomutase [Henriciella barbarensis]|uniref:Phosphomannomutase/phosphoglucomutase n=1 Tax=Henriciella barbarensis TaxID=86342 RepID=A0A399R5M7_9PROT|nr:phosphomannomutase/phosphoglucomutase [Henriciella barbarensis]